MSRLDKHVALVQNKLALNKIVYAFAVAIAGFAGVCLLVVLIARVFGRSVPHAEIWFFCGLAATVISSLAYGFYKRPTAQAAAVAIDERLSLKEKFSTALFARHSDDPFAQAAALDAERSADNVSLFRQFPIQFPKPAVTAMLLMVVALLTYWLMPPLNLFASAERPKTSTVDQKKVDETKKMINDAIALVDHAPDALANNEQIKLARADLENLLKQPIVDPEQTHRSALAALEQMKAAIKSEIEKSKEFSQAKSNEQMFKNMPSPMDPNTPVGKAQQDVKDGDFDKAVQDLQAAVDKFDKMTPEEQKKAAEQMAQMAAQMQQMANNPAQAQQTQAKLQQMGASAQQAQQMTQLMQQAAAGNQQAQQQLQQMAQQIQQQMNNGQGPTPQQQQQIQQMMTQMQSAANSQAAAQAMSQAAQQMAQGMQQAQQGAQASQGTQPGQPQQPAGQQQMAQGQAQMKTQLQQMQAAAADAKQIAAAQQAAQNAAQNAANGANSQGSGSSQGSSGQQGRNGQSPGQGAGGQGGANPNSGGPGGQGGAGGQWQPGGNPNQPGGGGGGGAAGGGGGQMGTSQAPFGTVPEMDPSKNNDGGKIIATTLVKGDQIAGDAKAQAQQAIKTGQEQAPDDVEQDGISGQSQKVVKGYFDAIQRDAQ